MDEQSMHADRMPDEQRRVREHSEQHYGVDAGRERRKRYGAA
jgi:hypothetical protein